MSEQIRFMVWAKDKGEQTAKEATYYSSKDAAEMFVGDGMPGIFSECPDGTIDVCVKHPDGKIEKFEVEVEIIFHARSRS